MKVMEASLPQAWVQQPQG